VVRDNTGQGNNNPASTDEGKGENESGNTARVHDNNKTAQYCRHLSGSNSTEKVTAILALIAAAASAFSAYCANEQNRIATKALLASQRPWVTAEQISLKSDLVFDREGGHVAVAYVLKNVGNTVGTHVEVEADVVPHVLQALVSDDPPYTASIMINVSLQASAVCKAFAEDSDKLSSENREWGESIFPNNTVPGSTAATMNSTEITQTMKESSTQPSGFFGIFNLCVTYRSPFDSQAHQTGYTFLVGKPDQIYKALIDPKGGRIPKSALAFEKFPGASGFAN